MTSWFRDPVPPDTEAELTVRSRRQSEVGWSEGRPRVREQSRSVNSSLRVLQKGREGILVLSGPPPTDVCFLWEDVAPLVKLSQPDSHRNMPRSSNTAASLPWDDSLLTEPQTVRLDFLQALEAELLSFDSRLKKVVRLNWSEEIDAVRIENTHGLSLSETRSSVTFLVEVLAEHAGETQSAWNVRTMRFKDDVSPRDVAMAVAEEAVSSLGARPIASGTYGAVLHPRVMAQWLDLLAEAASADVVQMGKSFLGPLGSEVGSRLLTVEDDPRRPRGASSAGFDDEGVSTQAVTLIENGMLKDLLFDLRTASKAGRMSNGHAARASLGESPCPGASNFSIRPGTAALDDLLRSEREMFYVWDVMGLHMADRITGEFSLGATGCLYRSGQKVHPVRSVTMSGRIGDVLKSVRGVAGDLSWFGDRGSPHILVSPVTVAGS